MAPSLQISLLLFYVVLLFEGQAQAEISGCEIAIKGGASAAPFSVIQRCPVHTENSFLVRPLSGQLTCVDAHGSFVPGGKGTCRKSGDDVLLGQIFSIPPKAHLCTVSCRGLCGEESSTATPVEEIGVYKPNSNEQDLVLPKCPKPAAVLKKKRLSKLRRRSL